MWKFIRRLARRLQCRRHRWRPLRQHPGEEFCDLCGARRNRKRRRAW